MGKKSTPKVPEPYDLQELLKYNTDLNRFDSVNPFGSQTWDEGPGGKWTMTQAISPELQNVYDQQLSFINQGPSRYETPGPMRDMQQVLMDKRSSLMGARPGYSPDVPQSASPMPQQGPPSPQQGPPAPQGNDRLAAALSSLGGGDNIGSAGYGTAMAAAAPGLKELLAQYRRQP